MVDNEVKVEETNVDTTENKFEVPESFKDKYSENPDKAIEELYQAQHKIVEQKKAEKKNPVTTETAWLSKEDLDKFYQEKRFFEENKYLEEHKEDILSFTSKGLSFEDARLLVEKKDPTIQNRAIAQKTNFTSGIPDFKQSTYTHDELANLPQNEYNKVMDLKTQGKVNIIK